MAQSALAQSRYNIVSYLRIKYVTPGCSSALPNGLKRTKRANACSKKRCRENTKEKKK
jgi:hypothetical protein